jgi:hypothetical protein
VWLTHSHDGLQCAAGEIMRVDRPSVIRRSLWQRHARLRLSQIGIVERYGETTNLQWHQLSHQLNKYKQAVDCHWAPAVQPS